MIVEKTFYGIACDNCKELYQGNDDYCYTEYSGDLEDEAVDNDWLTTEIDKEVDGKVYKQTDKIYCPDCAEKGEEGKLIIDQSRFKSI